MIVGPVRYPELCARGRQLLLDHGFTLVENSSTVPWTDEQLHALLPGADAAVAGVEVYDEAALEVADDLRIISRLGVGLDNVDLKVARTRGVDVVNVPGGNAAAVAELAVGFMLALARQLPAMNTASREGRWDRYVGVELAGKSVALLGFGAIARLVARRLSGFDVELKVYDPFVDADDVAAAGGRLVGLEEAVADVDVVSVHVPHTPSTHHLVDDALIARMRPGTLLVNTSRGGLVDQSALVRGLASGRVGGAGLDVFEQEPVDASNPLFAFDTVITSPHAAADTVEAYDRIGWATAQAVVDVFSGRTPANVAN
ncbi:phosphoglycerate dehydrogenase [Quadrisphaera setariae]|uniref:phosphoglycerate dehydrogenase n=1 Tax=Quadrisphaera setariae TaxID=2593304 RepID=UPI00164FE4F6|nr:phosphoglycerate dehydrogenase [Quadrisphaera setariae]